MTVPNKTTTCLLWAGVQTGVSVEEKNFDTEAEAKCYVYSLRRRGRTAWLKGDKRYASMEEV